MHSVAERARLCVVGIIHSCQLNYVRSRDMRSMIARPEQHLAMAHHARCNLAATIRVIVSDKANLMATQIGQLTALPNWHTRKCEMSKGD